MRLKPANAERVVRSLTPQKPCGFCADGEGMERQVSGAGKAQARSQETEEQVSSQGASTSVQDSGFRKWKNRIQDSGVRIQALLTDGL